MMIKRWPYLILSILTCLCTALVSVHGADNPSRPSAKEMSLERAVMCEYIEDFAPMNQAVVFSIDVGKISCFTSFSDIKQPTYAMHKWYRRDELVTTKRLSLKPPSWSTYSSIQLREADKGPWRVEILNHQSQLMKTLRFSVTD